MSRSEFETLDNNPPPILYHYTDSSGLLGILKSKQIWFSQAGFLNDSTEVTHADSVVREALNKRLKVASTEASRELIRRTLDSVNVFSTYGAASYVACFCESGDLLSQWRGYGSAGGGFALGFQSHQLEQYIKTGIEDAAGLVKVIYDSDKQAAFISETIEKFCKLVDDWQNAGWDPIKNKQLDSAHEELSLALADPYFRFKHPGFAEEREWRLVIFRKHSHPDLSFRASGPRLVPYFTINMGLPASSGNPSLLPLKQVICGPTQNQEIARQAIALRLDKEYPKGSIEIVSSGVPFRV